MENRTGTYIAFDGLGESDPTKSDFKYFATIKAWTVNDKIDFKHTDSHEKTDAVRDTSKLETLKDRIKERLSLSKNMLIILSDQTRKSGSMLSYEIEQAIDTYKIPLIIAYPDIAKIDGKMPSHRWPNALAERLNNNKGRAIHIPFSAFTISSAIKQFWINGEKPSHSKSWYTGY